MPAPHSNLPSPARARARLLQMHFEAKACHIGGNLSALDAMLHLHGRVMGEDDVFVLSKGHAAGALYVALWAAGQITDAELSRFHHPEGTRLAGHPVARWHKRIAFSTGSLGHGASLAAGAALAKELRGEPGTVFCLMSDGECQEGAVWEAMMFARHQRLSNLVFLVDVNGLQGFGTTRDVASMDRLGVRFAGFDLPVEEIDGHDPQALDAALARRGDLPMVILLNTVKGRGISFMEGRLEWHYLSLTPAQYDAALRELAV